MDKDGKAVFNSDAGVKVVNFIKELVDNGSMDQTTMNMAYDDVVDAFKSGTVDAVNAGTQRAATIMTSNFADNFTSCPIPGEKEGNQHRHMWQDKHLQLANMHRIRKWQWISSNSICLKKIKYSGCLQIVCRFVQEYLMMKASKKT